MVFSKVLAIFCVLFVRRSLRVVCTNTSEESVTRTKEGNDADSFEEGLLFG